MRVVFMGTPEFSVPTLEKIIEAGHEVVGVISQPDKPKGRGKAMQPTEVKAAALTHNLPVYQPKKVRDPEFIEELRGLQPEVIVVVAFGQILPKEILDMPKYGCINVHASLLPKYRGAAPIQWSIIDGEQETGVTTMFMDVGLDTGDMLLKVKTPIADDETGGTLHDRLAVMGGDLLVKTLEQLETGTVERIRQNDEESNYAKMLTKTLGYMNFNFSAVELERLIRGLNPWPSAYTNLDGKTLKVWRASVAEGEFKGENGQIIGVTKDSILVKTGKGALALEEVQLQGKKRMDVASFLRGYHVEEGTYLH